MLERLRKSVAGMLAKILIGLLVVSFSLWGIGDVFSPSQNPAVAEVGGEEIGASKFLRSFQQNYYRVRQNAVEQGIDINVEQARSAGLDREVMAQLISRALLEQSAYKLGLAIGKKELLETLQKDSTFHGAFGRFDPVVFKNTLVAAQFSEDDYLEELERTLIREQLLTIFATRPPPPKLLLREMYKAQNERRVAEYIILKKKTAKKVAPPSDETLEDFIDSHPADFTLLEKRRFEVLLLEPKRFTAAVKIPAREVKAEYQARKPEFQTPEQRSIQQITFTNKADAQKAYTKSKQGVSFTRLAKKQGLAKADVSLGWLESGQYLSDKIEKVALTLSRGAVGKPIETDLGWVLLRVANIKRAKQESFAKVRRKLERELAYNQVLEEIDELHDLIEDEVAGGETFATLAKKYKMRRVKSKLLTQQDALPKSLKKIKEVGTRVWASEQEGALEVLPTPSGGYYWLSLTEIQSSKIQTLADARSKALRLWRQQEKQRALKKQADVIAQKVAQGMSLQAASKIKPRRTPPLSLTAEDKLLSPILLRALFRTPRGGVFHGVGNNKEIIVAKVAGISQIKDNVKDRKRFTESLFNEINQLGTNENLGIYLNHREKQLGTATYPNNIDLAFERQPQTTAAR